MRDQCQAFIKISSQSPSQKRESEPDCIRRHTSFEPAAKLRVVGGHGSLPRGCFPGCEKCAQRLMQKVMRTGFCLG